MCDETSQEVDPQKLQGAEGRDEEKMHNISVGVGALSGGKV